MPERIPDAEPLKRAVPESLIPNKDGPRFPTISKQDLIELAQAGWERIGVIVLVIDPDGKVLTVTHGEGNPKVPAGMMGIISETLTYDADNVEQPAAGISELFSEELGLTDEEIHRLNLQTIEHGAWQNVTFPLGAGREALGLVIVLRADQKTADIMTKSATGFVPTREIRFADFMRPEPLAIHSSLTTIFRKATPEIMQTAMEHLTSPLPVTRVELPAPLQRRRRKFEDLKDLIP